MMDRVVRSLVFAVLLGWFVTVLATNETHSVRAVEVVARLLVDALFSGLTKIRQIAENEALPV